jgi:hypothetical protein
MREAEMQTFTFRVDHGPKEDDVMQAVAMWRLGWASRVVLNDPPDDSAATVEVTLEEDWESGPGDMVTWVRSKLSGN